MLNGFMIFYIDVGMLPPFKAEELLEKMKDYHKESVGKMRESGIEPIWLAVRPNSPTHVEFIPTSTEAKGLSVKSIQPDIVELFKIEGDI